MSSPLPVRTRRSADDDDDDGMDAESRCLGEAGDRLVREMDAYTPTKPDSLGKSRRYSTHPHTPIPDDGLASQNRSGIDFDSPRFGGAMDCYPEMPLPETPNPFVLDAETETEAESESGQGHSFSPMSLRRIVQLEAPGSGKFASPLIDSLSDGWC